MEEDLARFSGLSLILQHRDLVARLDAIEAAIDECRSARMTDKDTASRLLPALRSFVAVLPAHFAAESRSNTSLLRDCSDAAFARALEQLDSEHPGLLAQFAGSVDQLAFYLTAPEGAYRSSFEQAMAQLVDAIDEFRSHEAREDALFTE